MPAPKPQQPHGLIEYLVSGTKDSDSRATALERDNNYSPWVTATLLNSYAAPAAPMIGARYRWDYKAGALEFGGHIDTSGATTDTVAFVLMQPFRPDHDISFITDIYNGATFSIARCFINSVNGEVTLSWPAV